VVATGVDDLADDGATPVRIAGTAARLSSVATSPMMPSVLRRMIADNSPFRLVLCGLLDKGEIRHKAQAFTC
jgi:hypothetical protein